MKTSNKLLLGFFLLIILVITIGFIFLKIEIKRISQNDLGKNLLKIEVQKGYV
jgi:hypothetical protein